MHLSTLRIVPMERTGEQTSDNQRHASPIAEVSAITDDDKQDALAATLKVKVLRISSSNDHRRNILKEQPKSFTMTCTLPELLKLRRELKGCVDKRHCAICERIAGYLRICFERPGLIHLSRNGSNRLRISTVTFFLNRLLVFLSELEFANGRDQSSSEAKEDSHGHLEAIHFAFLQLDTDHVQVE